jgi:hypothetical protein
VAIQYSISYDDKGNPSLVKNTIEGSKPVIKTSFNIGEYKPVRTVQTDFDFDNINNETVYQSLQKYIYQNENNSDDSPKQQSEQDKFLKQSFEAAAARDDDNKIIGGSTFKEKIKMAAVNTYVDSKLNPIKSAIIGQVPVVGTIHKALTHAGSQYVDPYYDPADDYYYSTGFGMYDDSRKAQAARDDRLTSSGGVKIDNAYMYGSDYQGDDKPSDINAGAKAIAQTYEAIGRSRDNGGGQEQRDAGPGFSGSGTAAEMGSF